MKNLIDDLDYIQKFDKSDMLSLLEGFPGQLEKALRIVNAVYFPKEFGLVSNIVFSGLGGSAIGGDVVKCVLADEITLPFVVNRDYVIPSFVGPKTLFIASSYSGNTEETISAYNEAKKHRARIVAITTGGELGRLAKKDGRPLIEISERQMPPRCALGYSFVPVLAMLSKIKLIKDKGKDVAEAVKIISGLRDNLVGVGAPLRDNPAKKIALELFGRFCAIYGWSKNLDCAVTRWRNQFNENSKAFAASHFLPEMNHNEIMGFSHPKDLLKETVIIFLRDKADHHRVNDRIEITKRILRKRVHKVIEVNSRGNGLLARLCSLIYIGDFVSFYLAILNGEDPTPVDEITYLKKELAKERL